MFRTPLIITIDTEGDNLWARPRDITTRNAAFLPRFQSLCERFAFKPVYLVNHEMAMCDGFVEFGRDLIARDAAEIGMHLHAWNSPPLHALTSDDYYYQPYLIEYPAAVMKEKIKRLTGLLEERFEQRMVSHRAGRWAFDGRYAAMLIDAGYRVDCSVTPGLDWSGSTGAPHGEGGSDYTHFPHSPYFMTASDISLPAHGPLLEVPVTVHTGALYRKVPTAYRLPVVRWAAKKVSPPPRWLCPTPVHEKQNFQPMLHLARRKHNERPSHMEFMLHSSELMPDGSPAYRSSEDIERLYEHLEMLFGELALWCRGVTLKELDAQLRTAPGFAPVNEGLATQPSRAAMPA